MSYGLYGDGVKDIYNIDFSETVVQQMQMKYKMDEFPGLICSNSFNSKSFLLNFILKLLIFNLNISTDELMDITKMKFQDGVFDIVLDKGTLDSILV